MTSPISSFMPKAAPPNNLPHLSNLIRNTYKQTGYIYQTKHSSATYLENYIFALYSALISHKLIISIMFTVIILLVYLLMILNKLSKHIQRQRKSLNDKQLELQGKDPIIQENRILKQKIKSVEVALEVAQFKVQNKYELYIDKAKVMGENERLKEEINGIQQELKELTLHFLYENRKPLQEHLYHANDLEKDIQDSQDKCYVIKNEHQSIKQQLLSFKEQLQLKNQQTDHALQTSYFLIKQSREYITCLKAVILNLQQIQSTKPDHIHT